MLIERVVLELGDKCVAANTDGATFLIKKSNYKALQNIIKEWMDMTKLVLEEEKYDRMYFRDINNYIWVKEGKEPKLKGTFELKKAWHKDHSQACVAKALVSYFVDSIPIEESIRSNTDPYDFYKEIKLNKNMKLVGRKVDKDKIVSTEYSKLTRYAVTQSGEQLVKIMKVLNPTTYTDRYKKKIKNQSDIFDFTSDVKVEKDKEVMIESGFMSTVCNVHRSDIISKLNYDYYIQECKKVIRSVKNRNNEKITKSKLKSNSTLSLF